MNMKTKQVECPDCLGWGTYSTNDELRAGCLCDRCKGVGKILAIDSKIPNWNIGGSSDYSYGT
jgi:DnaJ-class molecular chaperone